MKRLFAGAALAGALGCFPVTSCVARGARVRTPRGPWRIEDLREGDEIYCVDPERGELVSSVVTATRSAQRECVRLGFGETELVLTSDHPVYCPDSREWAPAGDWVTGKRSRVLHVTDHGVAPIVVTVQETFAGVFEVFDLAVAHALHNFVANDVLVHNKEPLPPRCELPDGGTVFEFDVCTCPDQTEGSVECVAGNAVCVGCDSNADAGTGDGGTSDGGESDAGQ